MSSGRPARCDDPQSREECGIRAEARRLLALGRSHGIGDHGYQTTVEAADPRQIVGDGRRDGDHGRGFGLVLNFGRAEMAAGIRHAHDQDARVLVAINTIPEAGGFALWASAVDDAASLGADAVILADLGLLAYAAERQPQLRLHLSMQAAAANADAIRF